MHWILNYLVSTALYFKKKPFEVSMRKTCTLQSSEYTPTQSVEYPHKTATVLNSLRLSPHYALCCSIRSLA